MRYDVTDHSLLDDAAAGLDPDTLAEHNQLAEELLELDTDPRYDEADLLEKITRAVVIQVNYQVASGTTAEVQEQDSVAELRSTFRSVLGRFPTLSAQATALRDQVRAEYARRTPIESDDATWLVVSSRRR